MQGVWKNKKLLRFVHPSHMSEFRDIHERILGLLAENLDRALTYHDVDHTRRIIKRTEEVARHEQVSGRDMELLRLAALFHDVGFLKGREDHEEKGCDIAKEELEEFDLTEDEVERICGMIMATKIPQRPRNLLEKIIADADLYYLGTENYDEIAELLYLELNHFLPDFTHEKWLRIQVDFLRQHRYHTEFARKNLDPLKLQHLSRLAKALEAIG